VAGEDVGLDGVDDTGLMMRGVCEPLLPTRACYVCCMSTDRPATVSIEQLSPCATICPVLTGSDIN